MHKDILITSIVYFNQDLVKKHVDFLTTVRDKADIIVLENPSHNTPNISKHCINLVQQDKLSKYLLFDQNIGMNTFETLFNKVVNIDDYSYIIITDGDLTIETSGWLEEQINILDKYPDTYACGVKMSLENLPSTTLHPDADKWYPKSSKITEDYENGETGLNFLMYKSDILKQFLDFIKENQLTLMDTTMHVFCNMYLKKQWRRTRHSECYHHTWDLYKDLDDDYTKLKISKTRDEMWFHGNFCKYSLYEFNSLGKHPIFSRHSKYIKSEKIEKIEKPPVSFIKDKNKSMLMKKKKNKLLSLKKKKKKETVTDLIMTDNTNVLKKRRIVNTNNKFLNRRLIVNNNSSNSDNQHIKLNVGCGDKYFSNDWLNIDLLKNQIVPKNIKYKSMNILNTFPFKNVELIYSEHFVEHLTNHESIKFIHNSFESLKSGGILRIATFDLDILVDVCHSSNKNWKFDYCVKELGLEDRIKTRCELLNVSFNNWGHKYIYNAEDLENVFKKGGFTNIKFCNISESEHSELRNRETRINSTLIIEGTK
jgi:predicted SAM-dependent methyltransferase